MLKAQTTDRLRGVIAPLPSRERYSIASFLSHQLDAELTALQLPRTRRSGLQREPRSPAPRARPHRKEGRLPSHLDVAERRYPDLLQAEGVARG